MKYNVWIDPRGLIRVALPKRFAGNIFDDDSALLEELNSEHPFVLASEKTGRDRLAASLNVQGYTFSPDYKSVIQEAIDEGVDLTTPITPVTDFELGAYCDEFQDITCRKSTYGYVNGMRYPVKSWTYQFRTTFTRNKTHHGNNNVYSRSHQCQLDGRDKALRVFRNQSDFKDFLERPYRKQHIHMNEFWDVFNKPTVQTVTERWPHRIAENNRVLDMLEMFGDFKYYKGQRDYLARVGCKSHGYIVAEAGCGKSLFALSLIQMKGAKRSLIIAPQGTVKGEPEESGAKSASQWVEEVRRFTPCADVYELFSMKDYNKLIAKHGELPEGIYVTYYQALFTNGACEKVTRTMNDGKLYKLLGKNLTGPAKHRKLLSGDIGEEYNGIRCVAKPSMATLIGDQFDMVCIDEAHMAQNHRSQLSEGLIRLQPKYRFAFSATPIPNDISNLFAVMGWLCVPHWHEGHRSNAAFPFAREDFGRFTSLYMSKEKDLTLWATGDKKSATKSPIVSSPSHLVKILKSTMSFISKPDCNPDYVRPNVVNVRVDMGLQQSGLYNHYMDINNVLGTSAGIRATNQVTTLRSVCAEPMTSAYNTGMGKPLVTSPFTPKLVAMLEIIKDKIKLGEQVCVINSRQTTTSMLQELLKEADIECARIDSKTSGRHSKEANRFKAGDVPVMLMGIKCAAAHSFSQCSNLIISSIEWSNGVFTQAVGRVDRINSPKPPTIYVILYKHTIEEVMYDMMTIRNDAATLCIMGKRPDPAHYVDMDEILAQSIVEWGSNKPQAHDESEYETKWTQLRKDISDAASNSAQSKFGNIQVVPS
jgi:superfamily II DNA or RNA helicase